MFAGPCPSSTLAFWSSYKLRILVTVVALNANTYVQ